MKTAVILTLSFMIAACQHSPKAPAWMTSFAYAPEALHRIEIRAFGFPFVPVQIGADTLWLPFDTGNMVGLTLESKTFQGLGLPCSGRRNLRDSGGRLTSSSCVAQGVAATVFGVANDSVSVFEFNHDSLPGLVGPGSVPGNRFTLDYGASALAIDDGAGPDSVPGFIALPLVQSARLPLLILVMGRVQDHDVLIEIDTGKSRTTIDRGLVELLAEGETSEGARVGTVELGPRTWLVESARVVDTSGISKGLPIPISLGIGSDLLSEFVFTVDYSSGQLWIEAPE